MYIFAKKVGEGEGQPPQSPGSDAYDMYAKIKQNNVLVSNLYKGNEFQNLKHKKCHHYDKNVHFLNLSKL